MRVVCRALSPHRWALEILAHAQTGITHEGGLMP